MFRTTLIIAAAALALSACQKRVEPPGDVGVCYHAVPMTDGTIKYNKVGGPASSLEVCAARLEAMRIKFLMLGGNQREIMGAYQGNFLFLQREGIFTSPSLQSGRYLALVRTGDGRLAIPGAMPQQ
ncbi:hypothetical protein [Phenylobacterium sp.]|uniref:hypothetical protein n=1 Tax=Phenylobacterium sp. TaxID=1871053 RepID=UPI0035B2CC23